MIDLADAMRALLAACELKAESPLGFSANHEWCKARNDAAAALKAFDQLSDPPADDYNGKD